MMLREEHQLSENEEDFMQACRNRSMIYDPYYGRHNNIKIFFYISVRFSNSWISEKILDEKFLLDLIEIGASYSDNSGEGDVFISL